MSEHIYGAIPDSARVAPQTRVHHLQQMKAEGRKWAMLTAYDYSTKVTGPVTVAANDPTDFARQMAAKARRDRLVQPVGSRA